MSGDFKWLTGAISADVLLTPREQPPPSSGPTPPGMKTLKPQRGSGEEERAAEGEAEPLKQLGSFDSFDEGSSGREEEEDDDGAEVVRRWALAHGNASLSIICAYYDTPIPPRGTSLLFHPLDHLQPVGFTRAPPVPVALKGYQLDAQSLARCVYAGEPSAIPPALMSAEEAASVGSWAIATLCRSLALENVMAMLQGALLERQMVVFCPNLGVLSAVVTSLIPMLHPYVWQSVLLPVSHLRCGRRG